jgi:hypothetical protein
MLPTASSERPRREERVEKEDMIGLIALSPGWPRRIIQDMMVSVLKVVG